MKKNHINKKTRIFFANPFLKLYNDKKEPHESIILKSYLYQYLKIYYHKKKHMNKLF